MNERDKLIKKLIEEKGGSYKDYLNLLDSIAYHESAGTMDPAIKQFNGGPGRGKYQFEIGKNAGAITAARRTKNYYKENNIPVPEWLTKATSNKDLDVSGLTGEQQDILFLGNIRKHPKANFSNIWDGKESVKDFWANYHWAGKAKDRPARLASFEESLVKLRQRGKTKERIDSQPLYETTTTAVDNTAVRQPKVQAAPAPYYPPKQKQEVGHNTPNKQPELDFINPRGHMDSIIEYMKNINMNANGGLLNANSSDEFNSFNTGGSHEENPYGGIPLGVGNNGKMNTVEEGEASFDFEDGKYIFSNRLY